MLGAEQTLLNICELIVDCEHKTAPTQETGYPSIRTPNIGRGRLILDGVNRVSEEIYREWSKRAIPQTEDLILAREAPVGNVAIIPENLKVCLGQRTVLIRPNKDKVCPMFLVYFMLGDEIQSRLLGRSTGATVNHLNMRDIRNLELPKLPPLPTQRKIATVLSAYDDLIENNTRRIKILEEMAQAIYRQWFVEFRFPGHEGVEMVESELGLIPQGWEVKSFGEVSFNFDRQRKPLSGMVRSTMQGEYPYYGAAKILDHVNDYLFDGRYLLIAEDGSVITEDGKPVLQLVTGQFWVNNHAHIIQGKAPISTNFLYLFMSNVAISGYITGAAQPKINQNNLNRIPILVPPQGVLERFDKTIAPVFDDIATLDRKNTNLRQTRDLLLPKLISGEIDVSELDIDVSKS